MEYNPTPHKTWFLPELEGHTLAVYEYGNQNGTPVIVMHGGPGDKSKPKHVAGFDLTTTHVITFDQRGCGSSTPQGNLDHNTIKDSVLDIERIRTTLKIEQWYVSGGSWGSTLALYYAQQYPERSLGLLLTSIFLANQRAEEWAFTKEGGVEKLYPDVWDRRTQIFEKYHTNPQDFAQSLLPLLHDSQDDRTKEIVAGILNWEGNLSSTQQDVQYLSPADITDSDIASVKIMLHYEANNFFLAPNEILTNLSKIAHLPAVIVHGRYDVICPLEQAWQVHHALPQSELIILPSSGHRLTAEGTLARSLAYQKFLITQK